MDFPTCVLKLLSDSWLFFLDDEITWDGHHHQINGVQVNAAKINGLLDFARQSIADFDDIDEVLRYFVMYLRGIEADEGLMVPRSSIHPDIYGAIRQGDLTGITFANLAACGGALKVDWIQPNRYVIGYDARLEKGIPDFLLLAARLIWAMRQGSKWLKDEPFVALFESFECSATNYYIGDVEVPVPGGSDPQADSEGRTKSRLVIKVTPSFDVESEVYVALDGLETWESSELLDIAFDDLDDYDEVLPDVVDHWFHMGSDTYSYVDDVILHVTQCFPLEFNVSAWDVQSDESVEWVEGLLVGDEVQVAVDEWNSVFTTPTFSIIDRSGQLEAEGVSIIPGENECKALACLIPFLRATVCEVRPKSIAANKAEGAKFGVRLDLDIVDINSVLDWIHDLINKPYQERMLLSRTSLRGR